MAHGLSCSEVGGILPDQKSKPCLLHGQENSLLPSHQGRLQNVMESLLSEIK